MLVIMHFLRCSYRNSYELPGSELLTELQQSNSLGHLATEAQVAFVKM